MWMSNKYAIDSPPGKYLSSNYENLESESGSGQKIRINNITNNANKFENDIDSPDNRSPSLIKK